METESLRLDFHLSGMFINNFPIEIESLRLDFLWNGFFRKYLRRGNRVLKTRFMELKFQRLEFHLSGIVRN